MTQTHYRFEFGINWDADNPQLQTGFVQLDGSGQPTALASPHSLLVGDLLEFAIVDTTASPPAMDVKEVVVWFRPSEMTGDQSPLSVDSFVIPEAKIGAAASYASLYFTAGAPHKIYQAQSSEQKELVNQGRFLFTAWVRASRTVGSETIHRVWAVDPEMEVGTGGGTGGPPETK